MLVSAAKYWFTSLSRPALAISSRQMASASCTILYFFCGYIANDTDTEPRTREWLTEYQVIRDAEFQTGFSYFIFEQVTQRLDDLFEIYMLRQTAYVVVGLDDSCIAGTAFDHVRIDGACARKSTVPSFLDSRSKHG